MPAYKKQPTKLAILEKKKQLVQENLKLQLIKKLTTGSHDKKRMISADFVIKCEKATALGSEAVGLTYCVNKVLKTLHASPGS